MSEVWSDTYNVYIHQFQSELLITKFTCSSRSTEFKDILSSNISQMIIKTITNQHENRWSSASCFEFIGKWMETETTAWSEFPNWGKAFVEQILASEARNNSKRGGLWESQLRIQVWKLTIWVKLFKIIKKVSQSLWLMLKSPKANTADGLINSINIQYSVIVIQWYIFWF